MANEKIQQLEKVLQGYSEKNLIITMRGSPDPDCISSALAHKMILKKFGVNSVISHSEKIDDQENKASIKLLEIDMQYEEDEKVDLGDFAGYCLVDSQRCDEKYVEVFKGKPLVSLVDHHDKEKGVKAKFEDIRKDVGSTATIYVGYLKSLELLKKNNEETSKLATALMHGIRTDTNGLLEAKTSDHEACAFLSPFVDYDSLKKISAQLLSPQTMDIISKAYLAKKLEGSYILSGVGFVKKSERNALPRAANHLIQREGTHTVLVYGIVDDQVDCRFRTTSDSVQPSVFLKELFPELQSPGGSYGGKQAQGGFTLNIGSILNGLVKYEKEDLVCQVVDTLFQNRFHEIVGESGENSNSK